MWTSVWTLAWGPVNVRLSGLQSGIVQLLGWSYLLRCGKVEGKEQVDSKLCQLLSGFCWRHPCALRFMAAWGCEGCPELTSCCSVWGKWLLESAGKNVFFCNALASCPQADSWSFSKTQLYLLFLPWLFRHSLLFCISSKLFSSSNSISHSTRFYLFVFIFLLKLVAL